MVGVPGVPGQRVRKPVESDLKTGNEPVWDMGNAQGHMRRRAIVTQRNVPVKHVLLSFKKMTSK